MKQNTTDWTPAESSSSIPKRFKTMGGGAMEFGERMSVLGFCGFGAVSGLRAGLCVLLNWACDPSIVCGCVYLFRCLCVINCAIRFLFVVQRIYLFVNVSFLVVDSDLRNK